MKTISTKYGSTNSKYCYPGTDILVNKLDFREEKDLQKADETLSTYRQFELFKDPIMGDFDMHHLQDIHFYIFQDLYDFAGKIREEDIAKGNTLFCMSQYIVPNANHLFVELSKDNFLAGKPPDQFAERASYYMAELNMLHPFRDGNGRAIREFIRCLALHCGYTLNWNLVNEHELLAASIKSISDPVPLAHCIKRMIEES